MPEQIPADRAARIIRAHVGNLETHVSNYPENGETAVYDLLAATSLFGELLAEHIERSERRFLQITEALVMFAEFNGMAVTALDGLISPREIDDANVREFTESQRRESGSEG